MATGAAAQARPASMGQVASSLAFDWWMAILPGWVVIGLYIDGWAHANLPTTLESFITPWHALLYTGMLTSLIVLSATLARNHAAGYPWAGSLPDGYLLSLAGALLFGIGGGLDMLWHNTFGIEVSTEALLSPTHLVLAVSGFLLMSGPIRAWQRRAVAPASWREWLPLLLSLLWVYALIAFFTQYAHGVRTPWAASSLAGRAKDDYEWMLGIDGFLVQSVLLTGVLLYALRRWPALPIGSVTLLLGSGILLMTSQGEEIQFAPMGLVAGIAGDGMLWWLRQSSERGLRLRIFSFVVPAVWTLSYFAVLWATEGTWWSIHLVSGSIVLSGMVGWMVSWLLFPPPGPGERPEVA